MRTSTMRPVRLTLSRFPDEPVGLNRQRVWVLALNEIGLLRVAQIVSAGTPSDPSDLTKGIWTPPPAELQTLREALEKALDTHAIVQDLRPD